MALKKKMKPKAWKHAGNVAWRKVAGEAVILDVDTAVYYSLGGVGFRIWELIGTAAPTSTIVETLLDEYEATRSRVEKDLDRLLAELKKEKIIEPA